MSESKESPGFVLNDAPRDPSYYHSPEPPPSKSRRWLPRLAMVIVFIALAALFIRLILGGWADNVLMAAPEEIRYLEEISFPYYDRICSSPVFGSDITRQEIGTVTFLSTLEDAPDDAWDVSADSSGSVLAWAVLNGDLYDLYIAGNGGVNGVYACHNLFAGYVNLTNIDFADSFHTEQSINMSHMFFNCHSLTKLDLSSFNTENVTDMSAMFRGCTRLEKLDLRNFNTEIVTDMSAMFWRCETLKELELSSFNTEKVTDMWGMFCSCSSLTELELSSFNTEAVTYMGEMFRDCRSLTNLILGSSFNTENVAGMSHMFKNCRNLTELDLSSFDTKNVWGMVEMFSGCPGVTVEDVAHFDTSSVEYYDNFMDGTGWEYLFS